jgi:dihydrolipoyl dehydrogenase
LLVVGEGYIGLALGSIYAALGSRVTVVELTDRLLPGVDRDLVKPLMKSAEKRFEAVHLPTKVMALAESEGAVQQRSDLYGTGVSIFPSQARPRSH